MSSQPERTSENLASGQRIDEICDAFEEQWLAGRRPQIEEFLNVESKEDRIALLRELVALEVDYRRQAGERPNREEYAIRFGESAFAEKAGLVPPSFLLELVASGPSPEMCWRKRLPAKETVRLGRDPASGWSVPWDVRISREHADIKLKNGRLRVSCIQAARNAAILDGQRVRELEIEPGQHFRIGQTVFRLVEAGQD